MEPAVVDLHEATIRAFIKHRQAGWNCNSALSLACEETGQRISLSVLRTWADDLGISLWVDDRLKPQCPTCGHRQWRKRE